MIEIDGSYGESGGQILRTSLGLSALTGKAFEITNIRKGRKRPGLMHQHLYCVRAQKELCNAVVEGDELYSTKLRFFPRELKARTLSVSIPTAGSVTLVLQSLLIPGIFLGKKVRFRLKGGTDTMHSQPYDYLANVLAPQLRRFAQIECSLMQRGYYPKGDGFVEVMVRPRYRIDEFPSFDEFYLNLKEKAPKIKLVKQGRLMLIKGKSHASKDLEKVSVAERQASSARQALQNLNVPINISTEYSTSLSTGSGITLWAIFGDENGELDELMPIILGADALGERGKRSEDVGKEAASELVRLIGSRAAVDPHLADQLLPFMALTSGSAITTSEITNHCRTNMHVIESFLQIKFRIEQNSISCD